VLLTFDGLSRSKASAGRVCQVIAMPLDEFAQDRMRETKSDDESSFGIAPVRNPERQR
jgi:hypothetical protein